MEQMQESQHLIDIAWIKIKKACEKELQEYKKEHIKDLEKLWKTYEDQSKIFYEEYKKKLYDQENI